MALPEVNAKTFRADVIDRGAPVLVDFWAPWCGPCTIMTPVMEELAAAYEGKLSIVAVNTDENSELAAAYSITTIPTFVLINEGAVVHTIRGARPKREMIKEIDGAIARLRQHDADAGGIGRTAR
jgi:thioredoxin 1